MNLETETRQILDKFEESTSSEVIDLLNQIQTSFKSQITRDYLKGKLDSISSATDETEKKKLCKNLKPYLDWYLQGL